MSDRLVLQLLFEARIPVRSRRGVCQRCFYSTYLMLIDYKSLDISLDMKKPEKEILRPKT
jgi:hypothetical protein